MQPRAGRAVGALRGKTARALVVCILAFAFAPTHARADDRADDRAELARLRAEAASIRQSLDRLDAKIQALEARLHVAPAAGAPSAGNASPEAPQPQTLLTLRGAWSGVERGQSQAKVRSLIGPPSRELSIDGSPVWYYVYPGIGRGSVFFDHRGTVTSVQAPAFGWSN